MSIYSYRLGLCIIAFMGRFPEAQQSAGEFREVLVALHERGNAKQMERAVRELTEWVEDLDPAARAEFDKYAASQGVVYSSKEYLSRIDKLIAQKALKSEEDFRDLREFVERSHADPAYKDRVERAVKLLGLFESSAGKP
jgi:hypothetical protein